MIKVGIAGLGKIGRIRLNELLKNKNVKVLAVHDKKKPSNLDSNIKFCNSFEDLLNQEIDAVFVCTFNNVLAEYTSTALKFGKHVFCEKPPARSTSELKDVIDIEKKSGKVLKYGFNHRYHNSVIEAKKIINSGKMGKILWLRGAYGKAGSIDYHKEWRNYKEISGGGILIDQGIHMLDLFRYFSAQDFDQINSFITTSYWDIEAEDNAFIIMQSNKKVTAMLHSSATQWKHKFLIEMCFENGYLILDGLLTPTSSYAPEKLIVGKRQSDNTKLNSKELKEKTLSFDEDFSWKLEIDEFINTIIGKTSIKNGSSDEAFKTLELVEKIYEKSGFYENRSNNFRPNDSSFFKK